ncbi:MAG: sensor histidine kinase [Oscillospiraceae bacterium]|jgi:signal transduction histidine kinase
MELWLWVSLGISLIVISILVTKLFLIRQSAKEIKTEFAEKLVTDTNTLIAISSCDRQMQQLTACINAELRKLRDERHRFQQGDLELKEAVANISHDLRTPLTAICGYLDLLEQETSSASVQRYLAVIRNRTDILKQLTEELFRYSVFTSVSNNTAYETVILNDVLEESISAYYAVLKNRHITPAITIPEQRIECRLNKNAVSRIFENIISNAIKYSDGDLCITLSEAGEVIFANHASQLDEIQVGKLFDRFYTVETAKKSTGLGLSIAKALTEQMNGSIQAEYQNGIVSIDLQFPIVQKQ